MPVIGLTGGIATGKSTVARMLAELGARVIDADAVARDVVAPGKPAWREIVDAFGPRILNEDGEVNRRLLAREAFGDREGLARLNRATHPHILAEIRRQLDDLAAAGCEVVAIDAPLLYETGLDDLADQVWVVTASASQQTERLLDRGLTRYEAAARIGAQMPLAEKARRADVIIDNSGDLAATRRQVEESWHRLMDAASRSGGNHGGFGLDGP